jgi:hypothetical protein
MRKKLKAHEKDKTNKWYFMRFFFFIENYLTDVLNFFSVHLPKLLFFLTETQNAYNQ